MTRSATRCCDGCGRKRKLYYGEALPFHGLCSECIVTIKDEAGIVKARKARPPRARYRKAYICIGGPLDGQYATTEDFHDREGMYAHLDDQYASYNSSGSYGGGRASMIYVHMSLIKPPISGRER
jgi:hypothetical protein